MSLVYLAECVRSTAWKRKTYHYNAIPAEQRVDHCLPEEHAVRKVLDSCPRGRRNVLETNRIANLVTVLAQQSRGITVTNLVTENAPDLTSYTRSYRSGSYPSRLGTCYDLGGGCITGFVKILRELSKKVNTYWRRGPNRSRVVLPHPVCPMIIVTP
jgi:hypothetical protein